MKLPEFEEMAPKARRRFLKWMAAALAAPAVPAALRHACADIVGDASAAEPPTCFIEIDLRDQWDHGHVYVAPGLATYANLQRGEYGRYAAMFYAPEELVQRPNDIFLTPDSMVLDPHIDTIAMIECCEMSLGAIHGHEAANALRSPGRSYEQSSGKMPMFNNDPVSNFPQGCEEFYSSTPTPASLHNYVQKTNDSSLRNGIAFKGISRTLHTVYHFGAGLPGAELDRIQSKDSLFQAFPEYVEDLNVLPSAEEAALLAKMLGKVDARFLQRRRFDSSAVETHLSNLSEVERLLYTAEPRVVSLPLTAEEEAYWSSGVPDQVGSDPKAQIWEQVAYAFKILKSGISRTVALEFDYLDVHDQRTVDQMATETNQVCLCLARLIESLKAAGLYERTVIAIYTADGGRSPAAGSSGSEGKNTIILAGGKVRGGYFGDVGVAEDLSDGHTYSYRAPDPATGMPGQAVTDNSARLEGKYVWRTVMRALSIPDSVCDQFPDVAGVQPLSWMLRA